MNAVAADTRRQFSPSPPREASSGSAALRQANGPRRESYYLETDPKLNDARDRQSLPKLARA